MNKAQPITFQALRSGEFDPPYLKHQHALKRLVAKHSHKKDNPLRTTVSIKSPWMGNTYTQQSKENIGLHRVTLLNLDI